MPTRVVTTDDTPTRECRPSKPSDVREAGTKLVSHLSQGKRHSNRSEDKGPGLIWMESHLARQISSAGDEPLDSKHLLQQQWKRGGENKQLQRWTSDQITACLHHAAGEREQTCISETRCQPSHKQITDKSSSWTIFTRHFYPKRHGLTMAGLNPSHSSVGRWSCNCSQHPQIRCALKSINLKLLQSSQF